MERRRTAVILFALFSACCAAAERTKIQLITRTDDRLGADFAFELKEAFRRSAIYDFSDTVRDTPMTLMLQTNTAVAGSLVTYSIIFTSDDRYITSTIGTCGLNVFASCAKSILSATDTALGMLYALSAPKPNPAK